MRPVLAILAAVLLAACARVEGTNRSQLLLTSPQQEDKLGADAYREILAKEKRSDDAAAQAYIERVGRRLAAVAPARGFAWEFALLESETINAFCLPGGKVAVYTGILPYAEHEAGLAAVLGHEIAHAIARHGGERMSQGVLAQGAEGLLAAWLEGRQTDPGLQKLSMAAFGAGSQVLVLLPFSREHESEADDLGLRYMAAAGYDPREAVGFWQRFAALEQGEGTPGWLRTHPLSADRAAALREQLPAAIRIYEAAAERHGAGEPVPARYRQAASAAR